MTVGSSSLGPSAMRQFLLALLVPTFLVPSFAFAQLSPDETGLDATGQEAYGELIDDQDLGGYIGSRVITPLLSLVGLIFLLLMIYAGFLWMTAGGNSDQVDKAKKFIVNGVIGLIITLTAYAISNFVVDTLQTANLAS